MFCFYLCSGCFVTVNGVSFFFYLCNGYDVTVNGVCFVFTCVMDMMSLLMGYVFYLFV